jgi:hypothetical protein
MLNEYLKNIDLKGRQIISLLGAPTCLDPALDSRSGCFRREENLWSRLDLRLVGPSGSRRDEKNNRLYTGFIWPRIGTIGVLLRIR